MSAKEDLQRAVALQEIQDVWGAGSAAQADEKTKASDKRPPEDEKDESRPDKWNRPGYKGRYGKGQPSGSWKRWDAQDQQQEGGGLDAATQHLLRTLVKATLRLDEDVSRLRADCNFMLFIDYESEAGTLQKLRGVAKTWQESFTAGKVTTSLRVVLFCGLLQLLRQKVESVQTDDALRDRLLRVGWLEDGVNALLPTWHYFRWDPSVQRQVVSEKPPLPQDRLLLCLDALEKGCTSPLVLLRFRSTRKLDDDTEMEVIPFMLSISLRGPESTACHAALQTLAYSGALKLLGLRLRPERVQQSNAAKDLTEAYLGVPYTDWTRRQPDWQRKPKPSQDAEMK